MRLVELPFQLCPGGAFTLAALVARTDEMHVGYSIWLGDGYSFDGSEPPASYQLAASANRFAHAAAIVRDYPAATDTLDFDFLLRILPAAPDNQLDTLTANSGLANELLIFAGDEILSILGWTLEDGGVYALQVARGRYGTQPAAHAAGDEVFIIHRAALTTITHPSFAPGVEASIKIALATGGFSEDLADVDAITHTFTGSGLAPQPSNLRVNLKEHGATFIAATDLRIDWSLPDQRRAIASGQNLRLRTLIEIVGAGDAVLWSKLTYQSHMKILGAKMDLIRDGETEFDVRLSTHVLGPEFQITSNPITLHVIQA